MRLSFVYILANLFVFGFAIIIQTKSGQIESDVVWKSRNGTSFRVFLGIPYAASPVGQLRFQPPAPCPKWAGVRNATEYGEKCLQRSWLNPQSGIRGNENCLFLNVYTRNANVQQLAPVLVFIHGGAFVSGSGDQLNPSNFMDYDVVIVTFNYRLGIFGFFSSGDVVIPGNYALKDQVAALKWVNRNIRAFGGDPNSVTLMGQSSGANNVHLHTLSPASKGLFHRAIILSGSAVSWWAYYPKTINMTYHTYNELIEKVDCVRNTTEESLTCLQALLASKLKDAEQSFLIPGECPFIFRPALEPAECKTPFMVDDPRELKYPNPQIPLILGFCSAEGLMNTLPYIYKYQNGSDFVKPFVEVMPQSLHYGNWLKSKKTKTITTLLMDFYISQSSLRVKDSRKIVNLYSDILFIMPAVDTAVTYKGKRYMFEFDYTSHKSLVNKVHQFNITGANHADDLLVLFNPNLTGSDLGVSTKMVKLFVSFINTGNPNSDESTEIEWMPVRSKAIDYLRITQNGFNMNSGLAERKNYKFYKQLPVGNASNARPSKIEGRQIIIVLLQAIGSVKLATFNLSSSNYSL